jgi:hypothetical protein
MFSLYKKIPTMRNFATTALSILLAITILPSCEKTSGIGQFDNVIIESENNRNKFKQITFIVSLENPSYGYLNLEKIDSLKIHVNGKYWGSFASELSDTTFKTNRIVNKIKYSDKPIKYLIIAPYQLKTDNLNSAGDFVDYLIARIVLTPGDYVCEIKEVKFKNINSEWISKKVQLFANFSVIENTTSSYVGNLTIPIN